MKLKFNSKRQQRNWWRASVAASTELVAGHGRSKLPGFCSADPLALLRAAGCNVSRMMIRQSQLAWREARLTRKRRRKLARQQYRHRSRCGPSADKWLLPLKPIDHVVCYIYRNPETLLLMEVSEVHYKDRSMDHLTNVCYGQGVGHGLLLV